MKAYVVVADGTDLTAKEWTQPRSARNNAMYETLGVQSMSEKPTTGSQCLHEFRLHVIAFDFATYCNEWSTKMSEKYGRCWIEDMPNIEYINISRKIKKDSHGIITKIEKAWEPGPYEYPHDGDWTFELTFGDGSTEQLGWCSESVYVSSIDENGKLTNTITGTGMRFFDRLNGRSEASR